jgi:hypothetical protein
MSKPKTLTPQQAARTVGTLRSVFNLIDEMRMACPHCGEPWPRWNVYVGYDTEPRGFATVPQRDAVNECLACGETVTVQPWRVWMKTPVQMRLWYAALIANEAKPCP